MSRALLFHTKVVRQALNSAKTISTSCAINNSKDSNDLSDDNVPPFIEKGETTSAKRARLLYQSRKRGMLENSILLSTFAKKYLDDFDEKHLHQYDRLINIPSNDWNIFYWATGVEPIPREYDNEVMNLLKKHIKNEKHESRLTQPNLN